VSNAIKLIGEASAAIVSGLGRGLPAAGHQGATIAIQMTVVCRLTV
jgi:hypothetical protein